MKRILVAIAVVGILAGLIACTSSSEKSYDIYWEENNLCVVMKHPTYGIVELGMPSWGDVKLEDVVKDLFNQIKKRPSNEEVVIWVRFQSSYTDKYGNVTKSYDDHEIVRIPVSEAVKYQSPEYLDQAYQITNNINKAAFGDIDPLNNTIANAREPYGDYICRYIVTPSTTLQASYNPLKITHYGIQVKNTNTGTKTWEATYQGPIRLTYSNGETHRFHNFYLTKQHVEFSISDTPFITYQGKKYYVINFDGQWQLAEGY